MERIVKGSRRPPTDNIAFTRISSPFVEIDFISAPAQVGCEQTARKSAADENKFG